MPSDSSGRGLSSCEVRDLWRYAVTTDFYAIDSSIETEKQLLGYESADRFVPFDHPIGKSWFTYSIDSTGRWLAIPDKSNIDIYDLESGERTVLKGHNSTMRDLGYSPIDPKLLVSYAERR
jgi:hypothetical protein